MTSSEARERYVEQSRRPLAAAVFVGLVVCAHAALSAALDREAGVLALGWLRDLIPSGRAFAMASLFAVALPLAWHVFSGDRWHLRWRVPAAMSGESLLLALPLALLAAALSGPALAAGGASDNAAGRVLLAIEAGVFEELVFRLVGFIVLDTVLSPLLGRRVTPWAALVLTSVAFAAHHHLPATDEAATVPLLAFRFVAGLWLGLIFLARGFGIAVGCHVAYNLVQLVACPRGT